MDNPIDPTYTESAKLLAILAMNCAKKQMHLNR